MAACSIACYVEGGPATGNNLRKLGCNLLKQVKSSEHVQQAVRALVRKRRDIGKGRFEY